MMPQTRRLTPQQILDSLDGLSRTELLRIETAARQAMSRKRVSARDAAVIERARRIHEIDGEVEIDPTQAVVSRAAGQAGCYVMGWLWVPGEEA